MGNLQAKAVLDTLANTLAELEGETLGDRLVIWRPRHESIQWLTRCQILRLKLLAQH